MNKLLNVHEVLSDAVQATKEQQPMITYSMKIDEELRDAAADICERNGTSLSEFLRQCALTLVSEYKS